MAKIAIGGFLHETNCFVPMRTSYEYYARGGDFPPLARGDQVIERTRGSSYGMSGFLDEMLERGRPPYRSFKKLPVLLPLNFQCTLVEPPKGIVDASAAREGGDILLFDLLDAVVLGNRNTVLSGKGDHFGA